MSQGKFMTGFECLVGGVYPETVRAFEVRIVWHRLEVRKLEVERPVRMILHWPDIK